MKVLHILVLLFVFEILTGFGIPASAYAVSFSDVIDFTGQVNTSPFYKFANVADNSGFSWAHDIQDDLSGPLDELESLEAELFLTYAKTEGNESWSLPGLGNLLKTAAVPITSHFVLGDSLLANLKTTGKLLLSLSEGTSGRDTLRLVQSKLSGNYELKLKKASSPAVPEPASLWLLSLGLGLYPLFNKRGLLKRS